MNKKAHIYTISSSLRGALHKTQNLPCQDYCASKINKNKLIAVVSDGAGSAKYGKIGAKIVCETLCDLLKRSGLQNIRRDVFNALTVARQKLELHRFNKSKSERNLVDFSATVVGVFCHKNRGVFFHIGDGAGIAWRQGDYHNLIISEPENGAFSCETFFYTMDDWQSCVRFVEFDDIDRIMLMTDGVTGFVFSDDFFKIRRNFFEPVVEYLEKQTCKTSAVKALKNTLNDAKAQRLNADDKTLFWAKLP